MASYSIPVLLDLHIGEYMRKVFANTLLALALLAAGTAAAQAQEVVRLGNLKLAHFGAVSYIKEIAPRWGIRVEEKVFAKGLDVMQAIIAGELDVGATASEAAISGRAGGAPVFVVAGFARGGHVWSRARA
jgi:NitT/TauT family transport system substrate-binding protein